MYKHILLVVFLLSSSCLWAKNSIDENSPHETDLSKTKNLSDKREAVIKPELLMEANLHLKKVLKRLDVMEEGYSITKSFIDIQRDKESGEFYIHDIRVYIEISGIEGMWEVFISE